jgi:hypothetical protein
VRIKIEREKEIGPISVNEELELIQSKLFTPNQFDLIFTFYPQIKLLKPNYHT